MAGAAPYGALRDGAIGIAGDRIAWSERRVTCRAAPRERSMRVAIGSRPDSSTATPTSSMPAIAPTSSRRGRTGRRYAEISRAGGGIAATVRATRAASRQTSLSRRAGRGSPRSRAEGVTTIEIKSGYGLDAANERKHARGGAPASPKKQASRCAQRSSPRTRCRRNTPDVPTIMSMWFAATSFPRLRASGFADAVDAFCENICVHARADAARVRRRALAWARRQAARGSAVRFGRRRAGRGIRRAVRGSPRMDERGRGRGDGARRNGRGAAARGVLRAARDTRAADCSASRARRPDGGRDRLQSRNFAGGVARADAQHGLHAVPD